MKKIRFLDTKVTHKITRESDNNIYFLNSYGTEAIVRKNNTGYEIIEDNMITGKEAMNAALENKRVEFKLKNGGHWVDFNAATWSVDDLLDPRYIFRIKVSTITLNGIEVPAPFEPKIDEFYYCISQFDACGYTRYRKDDNFGYGYDQFGAWQTEGEIKQVVAALRSIFATA